MVSALQAAMSDYWQDAIPSRCWLEGLQISFGEREGNLQKSEKAVSFNHPPTRGGIPQRSLMCDVSLYVHLSVLSIAFGVLASTRLRKRIQKRTFIAENLRFALFDTNPNKLYKISEARPPPERAAFFVLMAKRFFFSYAASDTPH